MYLGLQDLVDRWVYTRQGVHKLVRLPGFPKPAFAVNRGRVKVWVLAEIEAFESHHPEVISESAKRSKVIGYYLAAQKGTAS